MANDTGNDVDAINEGIPYVFDVSKARFWVHYGFVAAGFLLAVITYFSQCKEPAPYGKHASDAPKKGWGPMIPQRLGHMASDGFCCVLFFVMIYAAYGENNTSYTGYVFLAMWLAHYVHRGLLHPLLMRYSRSHVQLGIVAGTVAPNLLYSFINSDWISSAKYDNYYYRDPRFIIGIVLFLVGYIMNRWADLRLRRLRQEPSILNDGSAQKYAMPRGGLFDYVTCPNYLGEATEWLGWAIATWSLAGLVWLLFCLATFVPRAMHNHTWYKTTFSNYPTQRKALIPFVY
ncbi:uncharacterized protein LOC135806304 [Sycon ciliatum]|uniref:uncharacterized protein LOC135806304 n=1 Tax=Sycon ciliatum TaxID=27933 RepID=UPI0031F5F7BA